MGPNPANPTNIPTLTPVCSNLALLIPNIASLKTFPQTSTQVQPSRTDGISPCGRAKVYK